MDIQCGKCGIALQLEEQYAGLEFNCPECNAVNIAPKLAPVQASVIQNTPPQTQQSTSNKRVKNLSCQQCGGEMKKKTVTEGQAMGCALALLFIVIGGILCSTLIGAVIGVPIIIVALFIGGKRKKIWKCKGCGSVVNRG